MGELVAPNPGGEKAGQTAVTDLTVFPPLAAAYVGPETGNSNSLGWAKIEDFDLELSCDGAEVFAGLKLLGIRLEDGAIADDTFTAAATDICTATAHGLNTGDGPVQVSSSGTLPAGLEAGTDYWIVKIDANTFYFAASIEDAFAGNAVDITDTGSGTHTLSDDVTDATTQLVRYYAMGLLGPASDGALTLAANERYSVRIEHRPVCVGYALICSTHTNSTAASVNLVPVHRGYS